MRRRVAQREWPNESEGYAAIDKTKTAADYAAIAVAPLLIFLMISSLANFLMLILYHGSYPQRVSWTLLMFTLGAVGIARVAIERDRAYSLGYAGILGIAAFVAMLRFVDSPIFSLFILALIAYLADVIVRDCTLIDDTVDASGQGLIDSGRLFLEKQIQPGSDIQAAESPGQPIARGKTHQPGRTVMYLALAALPLFGLGQFFLRNNAEVAARAQQLLAFYLFSALSLLVTTSFLGLRRYLRQRHVEMPSDVSIAWLGGGLALIAVVLLVAFVAPLPGSALASFELPAFLDSPSGNQASRHGWGEEGAEKSNPDAPATTSDPNSQDKEVQSITAAQGAPPGDVGDGSRDEGPTGKQQGGDQQSGGGGDKQDQSSKGDSSSQQENGSKQQSQQQSNPSSEESSSGESSSEESSSGESSSGESSSGESSSEQSGDDGSAESSSESSNEKEGQQQSESESPSGEESSSSQDSQSQESSEASGNQDQQPSEQQQDAGDRPGEASSGQGSPRSSSPSVTETLADAVPMFESLIKFAIFLVLAAIVVAFLWLHRHLIAQWWDNLFNKTDDDVEETFEEFLGSVTDVPPRAFASFRNPIGKESDLRRIIVITFQAFEAWTREQGTPRGKDETPSEFIRRVAQSVPDMSDPASQVVNAYNRIVYGRGNATDSDLNAATKVWHVMHSQ